jgi:hypothetical protein
MRSSLTSALPFLLITSLAACPGDGEVCGPGDAPDDGITVTGLGLELTYSGLLSGENNDCPIDGTPEGVISLTIAGTQVGDAQGLFTLCVPRPDQLGSGEDLGIDDPASEDPAVRVVDVGGSDISCIYDLDSSVAPTGTARAEGLCDPTGAEGFALVIDGEVTLTRTCGAVIDTVVVTLAGRAAIFPDT